MKFGFRRARHASLTNIIILRTVILSKTIENNSHDTTNGNT